MDSLTKVFMVFCDKLRKYFIYPTTPPYKLLNKEFYLLLDLRNGDIKGFTVENITITTNGKHKLLKELTVNIEPSILPDSLSGNVIFDNGFEPGGIIPKGKPNQSLYCTGEKVIQSPCSNVQKLIDKGYYKPYKLK